MQQGTFVRRLLHEAIERREAFEKQRKLAKGYSAGRRDAADLLQDLERAELELLDARVANCSMIMTYDRSRVVTKTATTSHDTMRAIETCMRTHLGMD